MIKLIIAQEYKAAPVIFYEGNNDRISFKFSSLGCNRYYMHVDSELYRSLYYPFKIEERVFTSPKTDLEAR